MLTEKERLHRALKKETVDRPPCICPGGMMNMITTDLMDICDVTWPEAHTDARMMASLALASYEHGCFENVGVPFCMTIEAEAMGAEVTMGTRNYEPHVTGYAADSVKDWRKLSRANMNEGRTKVVLDAIRILKAQNLNVPIIGNLVGPISTASSVIDPVPFYKELRKEKAESHAFLTFVTEQLIEFANAMVEAGADVIAISDPSGTGEILGPKFFEEYAVKYLNMLLDGIKDKHAGTIVHICGQMRSVYKQVDMLHADALSFDAVVPMREARKNLGDRVLMGNVSTFALEFGDEERIEKLTKACVDGGSNIVSPACGLGTKTPIANIRAILAKHKYRALPPSVSATLSCRLTFPQVVCNQNRPAKTPIRESSRFLLTSSHQFCSAITKSNALPTFASLYRYHYRFPQCIRLHRLVPRYEPPACRPVMFCRSFLLLQQLFSCFRRRSLRNLRSNL